MTVIEHNALEVIAPRTTLRVGENVQLKVIERLSDGSTRDLTSSKSGTVYKSIDAKLAMVDEDGIVTAFSTRGRRREEVSILIINGPLAGRISLTILPKDFKILN